MSTRRRHLYGDIYSSPGLCLAQKQMLMCAFLGEANMHEQLFGHLLAVHRAPGNVVLMHACKIMTIWQMGDSALIHHAWPPLKPKHCLARYPLGID